MNNMKLNMAEELVETVLFEQGHDTVLIDNYFKFHEYCGKQKYIQYDMHVMVDGTVMSLRSALGEDVYCMLVGLYGDYGTTMRGGWIENKKRFIELIEHMIIWTDYGVYHNFPERKVSSIKGRKKPVAKDSVYVYLQKDMEHFKAYCNKHDIVSDIIPTISHMITFIEECPETMVEKVLSGGGQVRQTRKH